VSSAIVVYGLLRLTFCRRCGIGRPSDAYHTCYVLSGLSSAQHITVSSTPSITVASATEVSPEDGTTSQATSDAAGAGNTGAVGWEVFPDFPEIQVFDERDRIAPIDPVYTIPLEERAAFISYFRAKTGF